MAHAAREAPPDYAALAELLTVLAYPVRLELLDRLRVPRTLGQIQVSPHRRDSKANPDRRVSRVTVLGHLEKLLSVGLVHQDSVQQKGRTVPLYSVNASRLYAVMESLRRLGVIFAGQGAGPDQTGTLAEGHPRRAPRGPRLTLVHGVYEGKSFPLTPEATKDDRWVIGRDRDMAVALDYDPYVSQPNAEVRLEDGRYVIRDLKSKNGTTVNWIPVQPQGQELHAGDIIGVGWSRLSFAAE